ncbi:4Fe-4S binding protein [Blautia schinkii]|nr:4Fe-4S binding protein [Blautia schinkii]
MIHYKKIIEKFQIPPEAEDIVEKVLEPLECELLSGWEGGDSFTLDELVDFLAAAQLLTDSETAESFVQRCFVRGVLDKAEGGRYRFGTFYGRLDIFATSESEAYRMLPQTKRQELDDWYFQRYLERLGSDSGVNPTADEVLPLDEVLSFIENKEEQPYLALCDCRMLTGECNSPTLTCITYRTADNSFVSRGHARPVTKEEAKQVVIEADRAGLMHTVNPGGVCNCCSDCCYLFRAAKARESLGSWPLPHYRIALDDEACIGCGVCVKRCHFEVIALNQAVNSDESAERSNAKRRQSIAEIVRPKLCVGCGICMTGCPSGALRLVPRNEREIGGSA